MHFQKQIKPLKVVLKSPEMSAYNLYLLQNPFPKMEVFEMLSILLLAPISTGCLLPPEVLANPWLQIPVRWCPSSAQCSSVVQTPEAALLKAHNPTLQATALRHGVEFTSHTAERPLWMASTKCRDTVEIWGRFTITLIYSSKSLAL